MAIQVGNVVNVVFGVPSAEKQCAPVRNAPPGSRIRFRFRNNSWVYCFVKTADGRLSPRSQPEQSRMKTFFVSEIRVVRIATNGPLSLTTDASIELSDEQPNCDPEDLEKAVRGLVEAISKTP